MNIIFVDFETYYSKEYSLKKLTTQEYIRDSSFQVHGAAVAINKGESKWFGWAALPKVLEKVIPGNIVVSHNTQFDHAILAWHYDLHPAKSIDTIALSRALIGEKLKSHSLDSIAKFLLGEEKGGFLSEVMGVRNLSPEQEQKLASYCVQDNTLCQKIFYRLIKHMPVKELHVMDWLCKCYTQPKLQLDTALLKKYHAKIVQQKMCALDDAGVEDVSQLMSNPKFAEALTALGVIPPTKVSPTTGKEAFAFAKTDEGLIALQDHEDVRVQALVAARLANKTTLAETRAEKFMSAARYGALPVSYLYSGAMTTHRLSGGGAMNMQNLPRGGDLRRAIMAPSGYQLIAGDLSQIELRITLALAGEQEAIEILKNGEDLYGWFGEQMYGYKIDKKTTPNERQIAKSAVLGCGYGMGPGRYYDYAKIMGITVDANTAETVVKFYRDTFSRVPKLWRRMDGILKVLHANEDYLCDVEGVVLFSTGRDPVFNDPCFRLHSGLCIKYPELEKDDVNGEWSYKRALGRTKLFGGKVLENIVQALARQIVIDQTLEVNKIYPVVMSTHDEIVCIVPNEEIEDGCEFLKNVMTKPLPYWPSLPLAAEVGHDVRYGDIIKH